MKSAFPKPDDVKRKVDGKALCLLCTIKYKKDQFKKKHHSSNGKTVPSSSTSVGTANRSHHRSSEHRTKRGPETDSEPTLKKQKLDPPLIESSQPHSILGTRDTQPLVDLLTSNHILETDKLQSEISTLKKQMLQKDQTLLEKDKVICQLKADASEKDRDFRAKQLSQQKAHGDLVEQLQSEIRSLRTQLVKLSQKKSSSAASDKQSSSLASIASSLAATPTSLNSS